MYPSVDWCIEYITMLIEALVCFYGVLLRVIHKVEVYNYVLSDLVYSSEPLTCLLINTLQQK